MNQSTIIEADAIVNSASVIAICHVLHPRTPLSSRSDHNELPDHIAAIILVTLAAAADTLIIASPTTSTSPPPCPFARYKAFVDTFFRKKSLVDAIFRTGHWNEALAGTFAGDLGGLVPSQSALPPKETHAARALRKDALRARMTRKKWLQGNVNPGRCQQCGWHTDWETHEWYQNRTQCWVCEDIVCKRWCAVEDHARSLVIPAAFQECPHVALRFRRLQSLQQASVQ